MVIIKFPLSKWSCCVDSDDYMLLQQILRKYAPYSRYDANNCGKSSILIINKKMNVYIYSKSGNIISSVELSSKYKIYNYIINTIRNNMQIDSHACILHGVAISIYNQKALLLGESGAGKSTLGAYVQMMNGSACLADDIILFDATTNRFSPLSNYIFLRESSISVINVARKDDLLMRNIMYDSFLNRFCLELTQKPLGEAFNIDDIYILSRGTNEIYIEKDQNQIESILKNMYLPYQVKSNLYCAMDLVGKKNITILHYNDLPKLYKYFVCKSGNS